MAFVYDLKTDIRYLEGVEEGLKGVEKTIIASVLKMYKKQMDISTIADLLSITEQKVVEIIQATN